MTYRAPASVPGPHRQAATAAVRRARIAPRRAAAAFDERSLKGVPSSVGLDGRKTKKPLGPTRPNRARARSCAELRPTQSRPVGAAHSQNGFFQPADRHAVTSNGVRSLSRRCCRAAIINGSRQASHAGFATPRSASNTAGNPSHFGHTHAPVAQPDRAADF